MNFWFVLRVVLHTASTIIILSCIGGYVFDKNGKSIVKTAVRLIAALVILLLVRDVMCKWSIDMEAAVATVIMLSITGLRKWGLAVAVSFSMTQIATITTNAVIVLATSKFSVVSAMELGYRLCGITEILTAIIVYARLRKNGAEIREALEQKSQVIYFAAAAALYLIEKGLHLEMRGDGRWEWVFHSIEFIFFSCILLMAFVIFLMYVYLSYQRKRLKEQVLFGKKCIARQMQQYEFISSTQQELSRFRHDSMAHLNAINHIAKEREDEAVSGYVENLLEHFDNVKYVDTGNMIVDAVLNQYFSICKAAGVEMTVVGRFGVDTGIDETDLCVILTNLISNAYEAAEKSRAKKIKIELSSFGDNQFISISNTASGETQARNGRLVSEKTTKKDKETHGFGIGNVIEAVKRSRGTVAWETGKSGDSLMVYARVRLPAGHEEMPHLSMERNER